jgi:hypothetical protein
MRAALNDELVRTRADRDATLGELTATRQVVDAMRRSWSWRVTRPIRKTKKFVRRTQSRWSRLGTEIRLKRRKWQGGGGSSLSPRLNPNREYPVNAPQNGIVVDGLSHSSDEYGTDYIAELRRILRQHVKPVTRSYLEWGAGHSTLAILQMREELGIEHFYSIDDNQSYLDQLVAQFPAWTGLHPILADVTGPIGNDRDPGLAYSTIPLSFKRQFDFIFIDGRRRLECAFIASLVSHRATAIALHDYRRERYQPVKALFEIVEDGPQFRVMRTR